MTILVAKYQGVFRKTKSVNHPVAFIFETLELFQCSAAGR